MTLDEEISQNIDNLTTVNKSVKITANSRVGRHGTPMKLQMPDVSVIDVVNKSSVYTPTNLLELNRLFMRLQFYSTLLPEPTLDTYLSELLTYMEKFDET